MSRTRHRRRHKRESVGCRCSYCEFKTAARPDPEPPPLVRLHDSMDTFDAIENDWFLGATDEC